MRLSPFSAITPTAATLVLLPVPADAVLLPLNNPAELAVMSGFASAGVGRIGK